RLNSSREWAELSLGRQTLHHDWLSGCRGLQKALFGSFLHPACIGLDYSTIGHRLIESVNVSPAGPRQLALRKADELRNRWSAGKGL
ncbi:MAG: hypothetical protein WAK55_25780, partial [Xanthobacteraceae bacterium]